MRLVALENISNGSETIGFRIFDSDTNQILNVPVITVMDAIKLRSIQIRNLMIKGGLLYTTDELPIIANENINILNNDLESLVNYSNAIISNKYKICKTVGDIQILKVIGIKDKYKADYINTTSRSNNWSKVLSPFFLPCKIAKNVENAWQFSKVYKEHTDINGEPTEKYFDWAHNGFNTEKANRYPMGRGVKPLYSYWEGEKLSYTEARKRIYIPLYARAVVQTEAFAYLKSLYISGENIILWDFDGYDHKKSGMSLDEVINSPTKKMGHAFVLLMILKGKIEVAKENVIIHNTKE